MCQSDKIFFTIFLIEDIHLRLHECDISSIQYVLFMNIHIDLCRKYHFYISFELNTVIIIDLYNHVDTKCIIYLLS